MRYTKVYPFHAKLEIHRRIRTIATNERGRKKTEINFEISSVTHFYILSNSFPIGNSHIAGVQQRIVLGDCVDDPPIFALHIWQNHWPKSSRIAETHLCVFFIVHMRILPYVLDECIRLWFQYFIKNEKKEKLKFKLALFY